MELLKPVIGKASSRKWQTQRRNILLEIIAEDPTHRWSTREMAAAMQLHPVVGRVQPNYGHMTAYRDYAVIERELGKRRAELADEYISIQLDLTYHLLEDLRKEYDALEHLDLSLIDDPAEFVRTSIARTRVKKDLVIAMDKILYRQQTLVPIAVPKEINVKSAHISMGLEAFQQAKKAALAPPKGMIVDGEYEVD